MSSNQIIVMPDFFKACHLTSVLSSYPLSIYSINSIGQDLPLSEGLKHSEVSLTGPSLDHSFEKNYPFHNLYSYLIHNIHRL